MHILLTNDDGPPNPYSSPYFAAFFRILTSPPFNHTVSVVIPSTQRSWIGKAHLLPPSVYPTTAQGSKNEQVSDVLTPSYYYPDTGNIAETPPWSSTSESSTTENNAAAKGRSDYWVLIPGTPATCTQLGLFHHDRLFPHFSKASSPTSTSTSQAQPAHQVHTPAASDSPIDLVISGPNFGRNTTAAFALSSGTLGGALEAAVVGVPSIAISFGFFTRQEPQELIDAACRLSVRIVEKLVRDCGAGAKREFVDGRLVRRDGEPEVADCFSVNVPLVEGVEEGEVRWSWMLNNKWPRGSLYRVVEDGGGNGAAVQGGKAAENGEETAPGQGSLSFKWSPDFKSVWKTVDDSMAGSDGVLVRDGITSVTPLRASFAGLYGVNGYKGVLKL